MLKVKHKNPTSKIKENNVSRKTQSNHTKMEEGNQKKPWDINNPSLRRPKEEAAMADLVSDVNSQSVREFVRNAGCADKQAYKHCP